MPKIAEHFDFAEDALLPPSHCVSVMHFALKSVWLQPGTC